MTITESILARLRGRAATAERNAQTYAANGYAGEAMRQHERAAAYALAAQDVEQIAHEYETAVELRDPIVQALRDIAEHDGCAAELERLAKRGVW